jgi:5-hydroxyisourate hydrolase
MTKLTTHVLDVYSGKPGNGITVDLFYINNNERKKINSVKLNSDGRSEKPLVKNITDTNKIPFLDDVVIKFGISNPKEHYHVPLLVSPWSYSTYRGS